MANLNVTYEQMTAASDKLRAGQAEIEQNLQNLRSLVSQLVADGFTTSSASGAFDAAYSEFNSGATQTIQGIDGMAQFLQTAAQVLQQTDEELAKQLGR
ncbi:WXG100 family type VII secretion target [Demequina aestuarii]|uniref:WXG100 family type VII secretion target n=1 Tax=Demequina aestuarii TaxID=327095 RepID=UPI00078553DA|nr:WXG100 family type VII secretion target [Demequina aestuarii]